MAQFILVGQIAYNVANIHSVIVSRNPNPPATGDADELTVTFNDGHASISVIDRDVNTFRLAWAALGLPRLPVA